jgi:hypothetical protein
MFYVMKRDKTAVTGWVTVGTTETKRKAEKIAKEKDTLLNGKPLNLCRVWTVERYREYLFSSVSPDYKS